MCRSKFKVVDGKLRWKSGVKAQKDATPGELAAKDGLVLLGFTQYKESDIIFILQNPKAGIDDA